MAKSTKTTSHAPKRAYQVVAPFVVHLGSSIYKSGAIVQLTDEQAAIHASRVEPYPQSPEVLAARALAAQAQHDTTPRQWIVREGFVLFRGDEMHAAGSVLSLTPAEAAKHAAQIEPLDNFTPPAPPAPESLETRPFVVRHGFRPTWRGEIRKAGEILHMNASEAHAYAHMVEPAAKAARAA